MNCDRCGLSLDETINSTTYSFVCRYCTIKYNLCESCFGKYLTKRGSKCVCCIREEKIGEILDGHL